MEQVGIIGCLRGCRSTLATAIEFARTRRTFGKRLIDHQALTVSLDYELQIMGGLMIFQF
jgi:alkylation response protein AidB-like acyl-CoA dehydrogenase